jgi:hypothetical protein
MGNDPARNCLVLSHSPSSWWIFEGTVAFVTLLIQDAKVSFTVYININQSFSSEKVKTMQNLDNIFTHECRNTAQNC